MDGFGGPRIESITDPDERVAEIQKQMAYLKWRRTQVEHSIRNITANARRLSEEQSLMQIAANATLEKQRWTQEVVADELMKPLELSKQFVYDLEAMERREADAEEMTTEHHLRSLNKLKKRILESPTKKGDPGLIAKVSALEMHLRS